MDKKNPSGFSTTNISDPCAFSLRITIFSPSWMSFKGKTWKFYD